MGLLIKGRSGGVKSRDLGNFGAHSEREFTQFFALLTPGSEPACLDLVPEHTRGGAI